MNCVRGGSCSVMASIHSSSCAACASLNAVRCSLASLEEGRGVATADPTSRRRDWIVSSCRGRGGGRWRGREGEGGREGWAGSQAHLPSLLSPCPAAPLINTHMHARHHAHLQGQARIQLLGVLPRQAQRGVDFIHVPQGGKHGVVLGAPLPAVQAAAAAVPGLGVDLHAAAAKGAPEGAGTGGQGLGAGWGPGRRSLVASSRQRRGGGRQRRSSSSHTCVRCPAHD